MHTHSAHINACQLTLHSCKQNRTILPKIRQTNALEILLAKSQVFK